jgi:hypothetical protein
LLLLLSLYLLLLQRLDAIEFAFKDQPSFFPSDL